ncbi:pilin [Candidatus Saccharibacteria bacterium]|nr:pilin [Candidatus Saccharibacteria bacterium]
MIKKISTTLLLVPALVLGFGLFAPAVHAAPGDPCDETQGLAGAINEDCAVGEGMQTGSLFGNNGIVTTVINIMLFIVGILSVIMIIWGGIRYVLSRGKEDEVKNAKNTILYSVVGLIIAIIAYALVNWVFGVLGG